MVRGHNPVLRCLHAPEHELGLPLRPGHVPQDSEDGSLSAVSEMSSDELAEAHATRRHHFAGGLALQTAPPHHGRPSDLALVTYSRMAQAMAKASAMEAWQQPQGYEVPPGPQNGVQYGQPGAQLGPAQRPPLGSRFRLICDPSGNECEASDNYGGPAEQKVEESSQPTAEGGMTELLIALVLARKGTRRRLRDFL